MALEEAEELPLGDTELEGEEETTEAVTLREGEGLEVGQLLRLRVPVPDTQGVALEVG